MGPVARRLGRQLASWTTVVIALPVAVVTIPLWVPLAALADLAGGLHRFPTVRLGLFAIAYLVHQWVALATASWLWLTGGFGRRLDLDLHRRIQTWWGVSLLGWARRLLGVELEFGDTSELPTGRFILASRHASMVDAVLPIPLVCRDLDRFAHYVLKDQLRWDPAIALFGRRLGNEFVTRGRNTDDDLSGVRAMAEAALPDSALVIFPEGTYAGERTRERVLRSLERRVGDGSVPPEVAERARRFRRLLPPKPAGFNQLLEGQPGADVVVVGHVGLEGVAKLTGLRRRLPLDRPISVRWWVHTRSEIPVDAEARAEWLYLRWYELDIWVDDQLSTRSSW